MKLTSGRALGHHGDSDALRDAASPHYAPNSVREAAIICASARHCVSDPPARVAYVGDVCGACRGVRERMARELRARRLR